MRTYLLGLLATTLAACGGATPVANEPSGAAPSAAAAPAPASPTAAEPTAAEPTAAEPTAAEGEDDDGVCEGPECIARCDAKGRKGDCLAAGEALRDGTYGVAAQPAKAVSYLEKACTAKEREGCYALSQMLVGGTEGVAEDDAKAVKMLVAACELGRGQACDLLSKRAEAGEGVKKDHAKAIDWLGKGCAAEDYQVWTCNTLKKAVEAKDPIATKLVASWKKACAANDAKACTGIDRAGVP